LRVTLSQRGKASARLRGHRSRLLLLMARVDSRLARDAAALAAVSQAVSECPRCARVLTEAALLAARAGDFAQAERWQQAAESMVDEGSLRTQRERIALGRNLLEQTAAAPSVRAIQLRAERHALLGAWGRAYAELLPHRDRIERAGAEAAVHLAQVGFRAGDARVARELLERHAPRRASGLIREWTRDAGWEDTGGSPPPEWSIEQGCAW
jgi:hypothetical protein